MEALLALEDGRVWRGVAFGTEGTTTGEICFNTSMTGYQEILTDPSYTGQIVTMTYPIQGSYGCNSADAESEKPHVRGFVITELHELPSNWRSQQSLGEYFREHSLLGIQDIDTRSLTKHLRSKGAMNACITTELSESDAIQAAQSAPKMEGQDLAITVTTQSSALWEGESRNWTIPNHITGQTGTYEDLPEIRYNIVAYDFGIKHNILRRLRQAGFAVTLVPCTTSAEDVLSHSPDGIFLSNGPGDPSALSYAHAEVKTLIDKKIPIFGICLGHQILTHAVGGTTYKLKFGHRGGNQPVKDLRTGKIEITSQNHGFATNADSLPKNAEVTHLNLNDNTVEGFRLTDAPVFSVQHHPEAAPGPYDSTGFFEEFACLIEEHIGR